MMNQNEKDIVQNLSNVITTRNHLTTLLNNRNIKKPELQSLYSLISKLDSYIIQESLNLTITEQTKNLTTSDQDVIAKEPSEQIVSTEAKLETKSRPAFKKKKS